MRPFISSDCWPVSNSAIPVAVYTRSAPGLRMSTISEAFGRAARLRALRVLDDVATKRLPFSNKYQTAVRWMVPSAFWWRGWQCGVLARFHGQIGLAFALAFSLRRFGRFSGRPIVSLILGLRNVAGISTAMLVQFWFLHRLIRNVAQVSCTPSNPHLSVELSRYTATFAGLVTVLSGGGTDRSAVTLTRIGVSLNS